MKLFLKIAAGILAFFIVLIIALNLYFTDERLKSMILPPVQEAIGTEVQVERLSLTFFKTFPRFGIEMDSFVLPNPEGETVVSLRQLLMSVELFPLLRNELSVARLEMREPVLNYHVYEDGSSNIDFLMALADDEEEAEPDDQEFAIAIPRFTIESAAINYRDDTDNTIVTLSELDAEISLAFYDLIQSTIDARLGSLSASVDGTSYLDNLSLSLNQTSTIDLENEIVTLTEGIFSIRGLGLNLSGTISNWSADAPLFDLQFSSSSENFGELLRLAPPEFDEQLAGLETRGALVLEGSVSGSFTEDELPDFNLVIDVTDGFLQNPDLPEAIEDIVLRVDVSNELATIREFRARAAENTISGSGSLERPLEEDAVFSISFDGDVNLATISSFYPIEEFGVQSLSGLLAADLSANGRIDQAENAAFSGNFTLSDGSLQYTDVPRPIEQINAKVRANQDRIEIEESGFTAATNRFTMSGSVDNPLDEDRRRVDLSSRLNFDLATIKDFYPIDEDTLALRGQFDANVVLRGAADPDQIENLLQRSTFELRDGFIDHHTIGRPIEDITLIAAATGTQLSINQARFVVGENSLAMNGVVTNYLSDDPQFDLTFDGIALFSDIVDYYPLEPWISELTGNAQLSLNARGPAGDPMKIELNGSMEVSNVSAAGDSIPLPVTDLQGKLSITPTAMTLEQFSMNYGSSDIHLEGSLQNYLGFMEENHTSTATMPSISGSYRSSLLDMDEMIDWDEEVDPEQPIPIELPNLTSNVSAEIERLVIFGIPITNITGSGRTTNEQIVLDEADAELFEGTASGRMEWNVPSPDRTNITFNGSLDSLTAEAFFRDTGFLGNDSNFHEHVSGEFSAEINYFSEMDETITPDLTTTRADGNFGMTRARIRNHPVQQRVASLLNANELNNLALDEWNAQFSIRDTVLTFSDFRLTSENIGIELQGTQHLITEVIDYKALLFLPETFKSRIASVISNRAADALQQEDGTLAVPVLITGTSSSPQVRPDTSIINQIIEDAIRDGVRDRVRDFFGGE